MEVKRGFGGVGKVYDAVTLVGQRDDMLLHYSY